ncbi:hypothetical protein R3P38DRAFT_2797523 [Favolaschia claudopus]|uniref:F-box domain-containing protein n=1 Tax=Favolaschia claudopus TaxID=2862362 RepID=A0AAW0A348_9AGAR
MATYPFRRTLKSVSPRNTVYVSAYWSDSLRFDYAQKLKSFDCMKARVHISSLPVEILTKCLYLAPEPFEETPELWAPACGVISSVCPLWKSVVDNSPHMHSCIYIDNSCPTVELAKWIAASYSVPIEVHIRLSLGEYPLWGDYESSRIKMDESVSLLSLHIGRCRSLVLEASDSICSRIVLGSLMTLDVRGVERISLHLVRTPVGDITGLPGTPLPFSRGDCVLFSARCASLFAAYTVLRYCTNLTTLELDNCEEYFITTHDVIQVLEPLRSLLHLTFDNLEVYDDTFPPDEPMVVLRALQFLFVSACRPAGVRVLSYLSFPNLKALHLEIGTVQAAQSFIVDFGEKASKLEHLCIALPAVDFGTFMRLMNCFPSVRCIDARNCDAFFVSAFVALLLGWETRLGALRELRLPGPQERSLVKVLVMGLACRVPALADELAVVVPVGSDRSNAYAVQVAVLQNGKDVHLMDCFMPPPSRRPSIM